MKEYKVGHCIYQVYQGRFSLQNDYSWDEVEITPDELRELVKLLEKDEF